MIRICITNSLANIIYKECGVGHDVIVYIPKLFSWCDIDNEKINLLVQSEKK